MEEKTIEYINLAISEAAFYMFLYYVQFLMKVSGSLWTSSLALLILVNIFVFFCPVAKKMFK